MINGEKRAAQVCREHNLSKSELDRWRKEDEQRGEAAVTEKEVTEREAIERKVAELERFCGQVSWENAVVKKALRQVRSRSGTQ